MTQIVVLLTILLNLNSGIGPEKGFAAGQTGYNLLKPDAAVVLPSKLREISGLTIIDASTIACIEDENGILYFFDLRQNQITREFIFAGKGDYEDCALAGKTMYILRSDGTLFEIPDYTSKTASIAKYNTGIPSEDNEGLCYDTENNRVLIGCKGEIKKDKYDKKKGIFVFDPATKKLRPDPVIVLDPKMIKKSIESDKNRFPLKKEKYEKADVRISAIAVHPKTGYLYILSANDQLLYVINREGVLQNIEPLDKDLFRQAEGLAFFPNGDMLITNEGNGGKPTLLRFNYRPFQ